MNLARTIASCLSACALTLSIATSAFASDIRTYATVYSWSDFAVTPRGSHSFATFAKIDVETHQKMEQFTISWLPADLTYSLISPAEPARLLTLGESLNYAAANGLEVRRFGPFELEPQGYAMAVNQYNRLARGIASGTVLYKAMDGLTRAYHDGGDYPYSAMNCIHALGDAFGFMRTGAEIGPNASAMITNLMAERGAINFAPTLNPASVGFLLEQ